MASQVRFKIKLAWWWPWYANGVAAVAVLTRSEPDYDKVLALALRSLKVTVVRDDE